MNTNTYPESILTHVASISGILVAALISVNSIALLFQ
jgi:hypothetical protein